MLLKKITGLYKLFRFELPLSAGICVIMGQMLALGKFASLPESLLAFLSIFCISASILILNDYFDIETDKLNAPDRPIPSNLVSPSEAFILAIIVLLLGLMSGYFINITSFFISIVLFIIGFLYNWKFKKTGLPGNIMVSFSVGMTFIYGCVSVGLSVNKIVLLFAMIAALVDLGEEIAADSLDVKGDKLINSNSLAIKYGSKAAQNVSFIIFFIVVLLTLLPFILKWLPVFYLIPFAVMDSIILFSVFKLSKVDNSRKRKYIRSIYLGSTFGLLLFIMLRFVYGVV